MSNMRDICIASGLTLAPGLYLQRRFCSHDDKCSADKLSLGHCLTEASFVCRTPARQCAKRRNSAQCMKDIVELLTDLLIHAVVHGADHMLQ